MNNINENSLEHSVLDVLTESIQDIEEKSSTEKGVLSRAMSLAHRAGDEKVLTTKDGSKLRASSPTFGRAGDEKRRETKPHQDKVKQDLKRKIMSKLTPEQRKKVNLDTPEGRKAANAMIKRNIAKQGKNLPEGYYDENIELLDLRNMLEDLEYRIEELILVVETNKNDVSDDGEGLDAVQPKAVKKKFKDRKDKDIDNDGDVDSSDKYLHKRRKAISKAVAKEEVELDESDSYYAMQAAMEKAKKMGKVWARMGQHEKDALVKPEMLRRGYKQDPRSGRYHKEGLENSPNAANAQHLCAKNVVHEEWGEGECVPTMHAIPDEDGNVAWYDVMFEHGIEKGVVISELKVTKEMHHSHGKKKKDDSVMKDDEDLDEGIVQRTMAKVGMPTIGKGIEYLGKRFGTAQGRADAGLKKAQKKQHLAKTKADTAATKVDRERQLNRIKKQREVLKKERQKALGKESYEWGTDEYRKHVQEVTPGQDITDYQNFKVNSMKEALAKVWGLDEDYIVEATGKEIAAKMMKSKTMKAFAPKVSKMKSVTADDLEKMLPDYVAGGDIAKLFAGYMSSSYKEEKTATGEKKDEIDLNPKIGEKKER